MASAEQSPDPDPQSAVLAVISSWQGEDRPSDEERNELWTKAQEKYNLANEHWMKQHSLVQTGVYSVGWTVGTVAVLEIAEKVFQIGEGFTSISKLAKLDTSGITLAKILHIVENIDLKKNFTIREKLT